MKKTEFWYYDLKKWLIVTGAGAGTCLVFVFLVLIGILPERAAWVVFCLFVIFAAASFTYLILRILKPIKNLSQSFKLFNKGYIYDEVFRNNFPMDEGMKKAMEKFGVMLNKNKADYLVEKQVEYLTLQNQINPHFLYNTLEALRSEAVIAGHDSIAGMAETLAKYYRYTISKKEILVTLEEELENVKNYFAIQKYRFEDRIDLEIMGENLEKLPECYMLKLTLQPLVENAIQHGLETAIERKGLVELDFERTSRYVFISVRDYGVGMDEAKMDELNRMFQDPGAPWSVEFSKKTGIALRNVNARIKMLFGMEYGLYVMGAVGAGTEVRVTLPYLDEVSVRKYVEKLETERKER